MTQYCCTHAEYCSHISNVCNTTEFNGQIQVDFWEQKLSNHHECWMDMNHPNHLILDLIDIHRHLAYDNYVFILASLFSFFALVCLFFLCIKNIGRKNKG
jgi:hypothetical protein